PVWLQPKFHLVFPRHRGNDHTTIFGSQRSPVALPVFKTGRFPLDAGRVGSTPTGFRQPSRPDVILSGPASRRVTSALRSLSFASRGASPTTERRCNRRDGCIGR